VDKHEARQPWSGEFAALHYINVPRLAWLASKCHVEVPSELGHELPGPTSPMTMGYYVMVDDLLKRLRPAAVPLERVEDLSKVPDGELVSFLNRRARTRNYREHEPNKRTRDLTGKLGKDPLAYVDIANARLMLPIDPIYITTNTAMGDFRSGSLTLAGLGIVKEHSGELDGKSAIVVATPLALGLAVTTAWKSMMG
jgi:hypothetical protein